MTDVTSAVLLFLIVLIRSFSTVKNSPTTIINQISHQFFLFHLFITNIQKGIVRLFHNYVYVLSKATYQVSSIQPTTPANTNPLLFDTVQVFQCSPNENFLVETGTLTIVQTALNWFHLASGIPSFTKVNYNINGLPNYIGIAKANTAYAQNMASIDGMAWVAGGSTLSLSTQYSL